MLKFRKERARKKINKKSWTSLTLNLYMESYKCI